MQTNIKLLLTELHSYSSSSSLSSSSPLPMPRSSKSSSRSSRSNPPPSLPYLKYNQYKKFSKQTSYFCIISVNLVPAFSPLWPSLSVKDDFYVLWWIIQCDLHVIRLRNHLIFINCSFEVFRDSNPPHLTYFVLLSNALVVSMMSFALTENLSGSKIAKSKRTCL